MKQNQTQYKGWTIEHFPVTWTYASGENWDVDGYVILSPSFLQREEDDEKFYLPLYCEDEYGEEIEFPDLESAKKYIDDFLSQNKCNLVVKHGDEIHSEVKDEYRKYIFDDEADQDWANV